MDKTESSPNSVPGHPTSRGRRSGPDREFGVPPRSPTCVEPSSRCTHPQPCRNALFLGCGGRLGNCTFLREKSVPRSPPKTRRAPRDKHPQALPVTCATKEKELESKGGSKGLCLPLILSLQKAQKGSPRCFCTPKRAGFQASKQGGDPRSVRASSCAFQARPTTAPPAGRRQNLPSSAS